MAKRLGMLDLSWLLMQSEGTPMHVGVLLTFRRPVDAPATFLRDLAERFRATDEFVAPWNLKLRRGVVPAWIQDEQLDLDYHFRHSALPAPGGERELGVLVSRLHSIELDLRRPLWEIHLIEALERDRFALYFKMHHSLIDGVSGMRMLLGALSEDPADVAMAPPWTVGPAPRTRILTQATAVAREGGGGAGARSAAADLGRALFRRRAGRSPDETRTLPYQSPRSPLSVPLTAQRRFATQQVSLPRVKALAAAVDGTVNDIALWLCGTALRRFLLDSDSLPETPLTAAVPVNLRDEEDSATGTSIASLYVSLGTATADGRERLREIIGSSAAAKNHLRSLPKSGVLPYTMLTSAPFILGQLTRLDGAMPPMFSLGISNVPGPQRPQFLDGAELEAMYPISMLMRRGALNITCVSYTHTLNFGFTGARDALPHLQRLAVYLGEAMDELEKLLGPVTGEKSLR